MATENCIYRSINMTAGEVFVLPPGAELVSVSNAAAVTNSCGGDLPEIETKCYRIRWVLNRDPEGLITYLAPGVFLPVGVRIPNINNAWEDDDDDSLPITIENIIVGGNIISVGSISCRNLSGLEAVINASPIAGALTERKYKTGNNIGSLTAAEFAAWGNRYESGYSWFEIWFKSIETIGPEVNIHIGGGNDNIGNLPHFFAQEMDCVDYPTTSEVNTC